ncbi:MAG: acyl-CoA dehydrogenase family protein [Deltaproteobacteria bacterium]|jgi:alkylation response protein AidB-like acyl-CoA dehydrogenase
MASFYTDNDDLKFYVEKGIDWAPIVELTEFFHRSPDGFDKAEDAVEMYRDILALVGDFSAEEIASRAAQIDREGMEMKDGEVVFCGPLQEIFDQLKALELHGLTIPRELGGQNCPLTVFYLASELLARGDISVMTHNSFHGAMAMAMLVYSLQEGSTKFDLERGVIAETRFADAIEEIRSGQAWGAMDITEPNAGSDMARLSCVAKEEDGQWFLTGSKIFITSGHGKYHFVIARTEDAKDPDDPMAGLKGLSMFLAKAYDDTEDGRKRYVEIDRLEEKLGHHGSATTSLTFDRSPAQLIGKRGEGFKYMLLLMNNARVGVGFESLGLCESAYRMAKAYAEERVSMGKTIDRHEMIAEYLEEMQTDIQAIRALGVTCAVNEEMAQKTKMLLDAGFVADADRKEHERRQKRFARKSRRLTPLLKYFASEKAVEMARRCIQIHGGVGYTTEYGGEKLLRDAMVLPIYEGTSQIQSLMVMKDVLMGVLENPRRFARKVAQTKWRAASARDPLERRVARLQALALSSQQHLLTRTAAAKFSTLKGQPVQEWPQRFLENWDPKRDFSYAMLHAERLTQQLIDEAVVEILLEQARAYPERREVLERYLERAEPRARFLHDQITTTGGRLLARLEAEDAAASTQKAS